MSQIIQWCNTNNGFLTALLALLSLFISTLAVVVSVLTARLPYKKKIGLSCTNYFYSYGGNEEGLVISVVNLGNVPIKIIMMGFMINGMQLFPHDRIRECQKTINHAESADLFMPKTNKSLDSIMKIGNFKKVYIYMRDSEGVLHKKYFCNKDTFLSYFK